MLQKRLATLAYSVSVWHFRPIWISNGMSILLMDWLKIYTFNHKQYTIRTISLNLFYAINFLKEKWNCWKEIVFVSNIPHSPTHSFSLTLFQMLWCALSLRSFAIKSNPSSEAGSLIVVQVSCISNMLSILFVFIIITFSFYIFEYTIIRWCAFVDISYLLFSSITFCWKTFSRQFSCP